LGAATARLLAASGGNVVIADIRRETGEATANEIGAQFVECNVADEEQVRQAVAMAVSSFGRNYIGAVNCAGIGVAEKPLVEKGHIR